MNVKIDEARRFENILRSIKIFSSVDFCNKANSFLEHPTGTIIYIGINQYSALTAMKDESYYNYLTNACHNHVDGKPMSVIANFGLKIKTTRTATTDLLLEVLFHCVDSRIYLLGSKPGVAGKVIGHLESKYKNKLKGQIVGYHHGFFTKNENEDILQDIRRSGANMVFVGLGVPLQENWCIENRTHLNNLFVITCGGCFDFYTGDKVLPRAPKIMQELGFEWLFRFTREPRRLWRRYFIGGPQLVSIIINYFMYKIVKNFNPGK